MTITTTRAIFVAASAAFLNSGCFAGDSCFVRGTKVRTPDGDKNIEDLVVGDDVLAYDGERV
ncbi:MAG TPA: Hint domain-containing protein, partial [Myxococcota bacterium]